MAQEFCILPVRCRKCNAVFDLWYDLNEQEEARRVIEAGEGFMPQAFLNQSLCWNCRKEEFAESEEETDEEFETDAYEMLIDFE